MRKLLVLFVLLVTPFAFIACGGETEGTKVGLIVSAAGANDNGYNEYAIEGLDKAKEEFDITTQVVTSAEDVPGSIKTLAESGFNLIFSLEYDFNALITDDGSGKSIAEQYPDTTFVVFNAYANTDGGVKIHENVIEVLFNVNEGSFLAGALAVLVNENHELLFDAEEYDFTPTSTYRGLAFVGGTQSDGISVFGWGFAQGANYIASELDVQYNIYETYAAGFAATPAIRTEIDGYYDAGVNMIFAAAGGVSTAMKNSAAEKGKMSIDVDANQDASVPGHVLTSVLKNTDVAIYDLVMRYVNGTLDENVYIYDFSYEGNTGITDLSVIEAYIQDTTEAQNKWTEIKNKIQEIKEDIADGTIEVVDAQSGEDSPYPLSNVTKVN
jgi:basic membrane protein A